MVERADMVETVTRGRAGTAMEPFASVLAPSEIEAVVDFVLESFVREQRRNTAYHIPANGWFEHERYRAAFPFALGEIALDTPDENLSAAQREGKRLFMSTCITCHDRGHLEDDRTLWAPRAISWPRAGYSHREGRIDAESGATPYARHDVPPELTSADARLREGERLFQANCAFCHAADGSGSNWIGSFVEPRPRDLRDAGAMTEMSPQRLRAAIAAGVPGTAMPAWQTVFTAEQIDAVAAYVERVFISPAVAAP
jgi:cytochrome c oxidase cbb3-type subunit 3